MSKWEKAMMVIIWIVFIFYIMFLLKMLFFSRISITDLFDSNRYIERRINLIPFSTMSEFLFGHNGDLKSSAFVNIVGNMLIFAPFGFYLALFNKKDKIITVLLSIFMVTVAAEIIQWSLAIGVADIDDVILNTVGGFVGILIFKLINVIIKGKKKVSTVCAFLSLLCLPFIIYYLFFIMLKL